LFDGTGRFGTAAALGGSHPRSRMGEMVSPVSHKKVILPVNGTYSPSANTISNY